MARPAEFIRWLLIIGALVFFALQVRMFMSQTECAERVEKALEREQQWAEITRSLRQNLTASQDLIQSLQIKLGEIQKSSLSAVEAVQKAKGAETVQVDVLQKGQEQQVQPSPDAVPEKVLLEDSNKLPPGLRTLPPRLRRRSKPGTEDKPAKASPVKVLVAATDVKKEGAEELPPGLRGLPPRLKRRSNPADSMTVSKGGALAGSEAIKPAGSLGALAHPAKEPVAAVVIMTCNRANYLERTLQSVLKYHDSASGKFPLFISQDGTNTEVREKAQSFPQFLYMQHIEDAPPKPANANELIAYYRISEHYRWAFTQLFDVQKFSRVIILEDDMDLAPDFFSYFEATADLLDTDESLIAVSSWNDNGQKQFVQDPELLYRSDFFPGLGWMLKKSLWNELRPKWPKAYWDDWLRLEVNRKGRQTIRPEICRTFNFGEQGSSQGQFYHDFLAPIRLNEKPVVWSRKDLSFLLDVNYPDYFAEQLQMAKKADSVAAVSQAPQLANDVYLEYKDENQFRQIASAFGIFQEWKAGVPRTAYQGVVVFRFKGSNLVYLTGPNSKDLLTRKAAFSSTKRRRK